MDIAPLNVLINSGWTCPILKCKNHMNNILKNNPFCIFRDCFKSYSSTVVEDDKNDDAKLFIIPLPDDNDDDASVPPPN